MRKLTFVLTLVVLLVISTAAVYAAITWDDDPSVHIGNGYWAHLQPGTDDGVNVVWADVNGEVDDDKVEAEGCAEIEGSGEAAVRVWISRGEDGPTLGSVTEFGSAPGRLCAEVEVDLD